MSPYGRIQHFFLKCWLGHTSTSLFSLHSSIPLLEEDEGGSRLLCPVRALIAYIEATACIWWLDHFFVCCSGPKKGCALSKELLSHCIMDATTTAYDAMGHPLQTGAQCHCGSLPEFLYFAFMIWVLVIPRDSLVIRNTVLSTASSSQEA